MVEEEGGNRVEGGSGRLRATIGKQRSHTQRQARLFVTHLWCIPNLPVRYQGNLRARDYSQATDMIRILLTDTARQDSEKALTGISMCVPEWLLPRRLRSLQC